MLALAAVTAAANGFLTELLDGVIVMLGFHAGVVLRDRRVLAADPSSVVLRRSLGRSLQTISLSSGQGFSLLRNPGHSLFYRGGNV